MFSMDMPPFTRSVYTSFCSHVAWVRRLFKQANGSWPKLLGQNHMTSAVEQNFIVSKPTTQNDRDKVLSLLRGSQITIPHPEQLLRDWPAGINPESERLEADIKARLRSIFSDPRDCRRLQKLEAAGIAEFGASWWPYAKYESLFIGTCLSLWLFAWDDETDSLEFSDISSSFERSCKFRKETIAYIEHTLFSEPGNPPSGTSENRIITNFKDVGETLRSSSNTAQLTTFMDTLRFFVQMCEEEQALQRSQNLPSIEQYLRRRMGSSAVEVCLAIQEYCLGIVMPDDIMKCSSMKSIWCETNMIISIMNDMMSIKKELDNSQVDSLIPLLFMQCGSAQDAMNQAATMVRSAVQRFELAEKDLKERYSTDPVILGYINDFINGCKYACTGNANWSLTSGRYRLESPKDGGPITVIL